MGLIQNLQRGTRVRRRQKSLPTLLVPVTRGPIDNFYHFFMGYFVPAFDYLSRNPSDSVALVSIPPLDPWFDLLPAGRPRLVTQAVAMREAVLADSSGHGHRFTIQPLMYWDKWERFASRNLAAIAGEMKQAFEVQTQDIVTTTPEVIVVGRDHIPDFYAGESEKSYGAARRNISNLTDIADELGRHYSVEIVDGAKVTPAEMLVKCSSARALIGQHGAGLTNAFFLPRSAAMVEIIWPDFLENAHIGIYGPLCDQLGIRWSRPVLQNHPHAPVDPESVLNEVRSLLKN